MDQRQEEKEYQEKVVQIRRVTKVVSGGKKMGFRAVVVAGDLKTHVGLGIGQASEVAVAIRKGVDAAKKYLIKVPMIGTTLPHEVMGVFGASRVVLRPAPRGTGVIAGGSVRPILELAGIKNVVAKSIGSSNAINVARATMAALLSLKEIEEVEKIRGKKLLVKHVETFES